MVKFEQVAAKARRGVDVVLAAVRAVARTAGWVVQGPVFLSGLQAFGVLIVVGGVSEWSEPAANVLLGLVIVGAAEMWMRGDRHGPSN